MEIRNIAVIDSNKFLNLLLALDRETKFMMMEPGERDSSIENMRKRLSAIDESRVIFLGAYENDNLIGFINLSRGNANRAKHSAYVVIGILLAHTGKGIGKLLLNSAEEWAIKHNIIRL